jgi:hypothetical protein
MRIAGRDHRQYSIGLLESVVEIRKETRKVVRLMSTVPAVEALAEIGNDRRSRARMFEGRHHSRCDGQVAVVDHQRHRLTTGGLQTNLGTGMLALNQRKGDVVQDLGISHSDAGEGLGVKFEDSRGDIRDHVSGMYVPTNFRGYLPRSCSQAIAVFRFHDVNSGSCSPPVSRLDPADM